MNRRGDRPGEGERGSPGGDMGHRMPSRWSSGSPTNDNHSFPRGRGGGEGGRFHPYRGRQDYPAGGGDGNGFRGGPGGFQVPMSGGGGGGPPKRGFFGRGGSPDFADGNKFAKLFVGSVPRTATEEDIRPLFEEHGNIVEVALVRDRCGQQQEEGKVMETTNSWLLISVNNLCLQIASALLPLNATKRISPDLTSKS